MSITLKEHLWQYFNDEEKPLSESEIEGALEVIRLHTASKEKLRLVFDELKATNEAMEAVMIERDQLAERMRAALDDNAILAQNLDETMRTIQEMTPVVLRSAEMEAD